MSTTFINRTIALLVVVTFFVAHLTGCNSSNTRLSPSSEISNETLSVEYLDKTSVQASTESLDEISAKTLDESSNKTIPENYLFKGKAKNRIADCNIDIGDPIYILDIVYDPKLPLQYKIYCNVRNDVGYSFVLASDIYIETDFYGVGLVLKKNSDLKLLPGDIVFIYGLTYQKDPKQYRIVSDSNKAFIDYEDVKLLSEKNEFLGTESFGIALEGNKLNIKKGTWVRILFEEEESYTIQWYWGLEKISKKYISLANSHPNWESAQTAGMITPKPVSICLEMDSGCMNNTHQGQFLYMKTIDSIHVVGTNCELQKDTILQIWDTYDKNHMIACWYDKFMIVPINSLELCDFDCRNIPDNITTAGFLYNSSTFSKSDFHWKSNPTGKVKILENNTKAFTFEIDRQEITLKKDEYLTVFEFNESNSYFIFKKNDTIFYISKEKVIIS